MCYRARASSDKQLGVRADGTENVTGVGTFKHRRCLQQTQTYQCHVYTQQSTKTRLRLTLTDSYKFLIG